MKRKAMAVLALALFLSLPNPGRLAIPSPPAAVEANYGFSELDDSTIMSLLKQGSLVVVRQNDDQSLKNVTAGRLVDAPLEKVWEVIIDFEHYPLFMPQTTAERVLEKEGENRILVEQSIGVKIWRLPSVDVTYQLAQDLTPPGKVRFWHVSGTLEGTYGGWDLVRTGDRTMAFYTLYSNLTALGWGLGGILKAEPDFMTGVNVTTAMMVTKAVKEETERRLKQ